MNRLRPGRSSTIAAFSTDGRALAQMRARSLPADLRAPLPAASYIATPNAVRAGRQPADTGSRAGPRRLIEWGYLIGQAINSLRIR